MPCNGLVLSLLSLLGHLAGDIFLSLPLPTCCDGCLQDQVGVLLSAILWLGNIEFDPAGDDSVTVRRDEALANAAELLNLDEDELATALTERMLTAGMLLLPPC